MQLISSYLSFCVTCTFTEQCMLSLFIFSFSTKGIWGEKRKWCTPATVLHMQFLNHGWWSCVMDVSVDASWKCQPKWDRIWRCWPVCNHLTNHVIRTLDNKVCGLFIILSIRGLGWGFLKLLQQNWNHIIKLNVFVCWSIAISLHWN